MVNVASGGGGGGRKKRRGILYNPIGKPFNRTVKALNNETDSQRSRRVQAMGKRAGIDVSHMPAVRNTEGSKAKTWKQNSKGMKTAPQTTLTPKNGAEGRLRSAAAQPNAMDALLQQLMAYAGNSGSTVDYEEALRESANAIRDAYRHDIKAVRMGNRAARRDTKRNRQEMEGMYSALGKGYERSAKTEMKQSKREGDFLQNNSEEAAKFLGRQTNKDVAQTANLAADLGLGDLAGEATNDLRKGLKNERNRIVKEGVQDANREVRAGSIHRRFLNTQGQNVRGEGVQRSGDLLHDLQDFLQTQRQQIQTLKGQRSRELAANKTNTMSQVADMQQKADEEMWTRLMDVAGLKMDIEKERNDQQQHAQDLRAKMMEAQQSGQQSILPDTYANAQKFIDQMNHPQMGGQAQDALLNSKEARTGMWGVDGTNKMTPEQAAKMAEDWGRAKGLGDHDIRLLRLMAYSQMGG